MADHPAPAVHPTAIVATDASLGAGTRVWAFAQVREGARLGRDCNVGQAAYVGAGVAVGDRVKVHAGAYLFEGATVKDDAFIGPRAVLTNDRRPRASTPDGRSKSDADWTMAGVIVGRGASLGAACVILPGVIIGDHAMIGAGAVVTHDVSPNALVAGNPARPLGWVCACGQTIAGPGEAPARLLCADCG